MPAEIIAWLLSAGVAIKREVCVAGTIGPLKTVDRLALAREGGIDLDEVARAS